MSTLEAAAATLQLQQLCFPLKQAGAVANQQRSDNRNTNGEPKCVCSAASLGEGLLGGGHGNLCIDGNPLPGLTPNHSDDRSSEPGRHRITSVKEPIRRRAAQQPTSGWRCAIHGHDIIDLVMFNPAQISQCHISLNMTLWLKIR